jgi:hypothetical protein
MTNLRITHTQNWTHTDGSKGRQVDTLLCEITKEDAYLVEFNVIAVENTINPLPSGATHLEGGFIMKRKLIDYEGKAGMMLVTKA